jgi:hypothetical protein
MGKNELHLNGVDDEFRDGVDAARHHELTVQVRNHKGVKAQVKQPLVRDLNKQTIKEKTQLNQWLSPICVHGK